MKNNKGLKVWLILFILLSLGLGGYIVYDKVLKVRPINDKQEEAVQNEEIDGDKVCKLEEDRDFIYDAPYEKNVHANSYTTIYNNTYYAKDIIVPFINIDSEYVKSSNNEIKTIFDSVIEIYNKGVQDKESYVDECNYKKYTSDDLLSVLVTYGVGATDIVNANYYTYNIDLKTGEKLTFEEVYKLVGFNSSNINNKVEEAITKVSKEKMSSFALDSEVTDFSTYTTTSINNYKKSLNNNSLKYFISEKGKLNIIVTLNIPVGQEEFDTIIEIN